MFALLSFFIGSLSFQAQRTLDQTVMRKASDSHSENTRVGAPTLIQRICDR